MTNTAMAVSPATQGYVTVREITEDILTQFIEYLDVAPKTMETYMISLRQFYRWMSDKGIKQPVREDVMAFRDELLQNHKPSTVQGYLTAVKLFFEWTEYMGIYPNISKHIKGVRLDREPKKDYLTPEQCQDVLDSIDRSTLTGLRDYAMMALMMADGLRTIEVERANIEDLTVKSGRTVLYVQGKGHTERSMSVNIDPRIDKIIREYLKARGVSDGKAPLFASTSHNSYGQRIAARTIGCIVKKHLRGAGYDSERLTAHSLRHTAVTLARIGGEPLQAVSQFARHSSIAVTQIYDHALEAANNTCSGTVCDMIFK